MASSASIPAPRLPVDRITRSPFHALGHRLGGSTQLADDLGAICVPDLHLVINSRDVGDGLPSLIDPGFQLQQWIAGTRLLAKRWPEHHRDQIPHRVVSPVAQAVSQQR